MVFGVTVLERIAGYVAGLDHARLSDLERDALSRHLVDTVGAMVVGRSTPEGQALQRLTGSLDAVGLRCATVRLTEIDDIHLPSCVTPGSVVVPVALVMAARTPAADAADFAAGLAAGYELLTRLGTAIRGPEVLYRGIWPTCFAAPFAAAGVAARILRLSETETAHALSMALTLSAGRVGGWGDGWSSRWLVLGHAAQAGCLAAFAAAQGYSGDTKLLDGDWLVSAHGLEPRTECLTDGLGDASAVTALSIKPFCSAKQAIAAIYGFRQMLARGLDPAEILSVRVHVPGFYRAMIGQPMVTGDRISSIISAPYQLALAAIEPSGLSDVARTEFRSGDALDALMAKVSVVEDQGLERHYPENWPARVEVETASGTETELVIEAPGDPGRRFGRDETAAKFRRFVEPVLGEADCETWLRLGFDALDDGGSLAALTKRVDDLFA